jgi:adenosylcobinamide-GDP ribazoletransferase
MIRQPAMTEDVTTVTYGDKAGRQRTAGELDRISRRADNRGMAHDIEDKPDWIDSLRLALSFLTRIPVSAPEDVPLARAATVFPLIGAGVGLAGGLAYVLAHWIGLEPWLSAVFAILVMLMVTGALHDDGLADVADGLGVHGERERKLEAMRDSRIGAFGVIALVLSLCARIGALALIAKPGLVLLALVAAGALSRSLVVVAMRMMPPAREDGLGAGAGTPDFAETMVALVIGAAFTIAMLFPWAWILALLFAGGAAALMALVARRSFGGQTGDVLGAIQIVAEIGVLTAVVSAL